MISKKKLYEVIACNIHDDQIAISKIVKILKNTKYAYESTIKKIAKTRKFKEFLCKHKRTNLEIIKEYLIDGKCPAKPPSYRSSDKNYERLCKKLNKKNTLRNRLYVYKYWTTIFKSGTQQSENLSEESAIRSLDASNTALQLLEGAIQYPVDELAMAPFMGLSLANNGSESPVYDPSHESSPSSQADPLENLLSSTPADWTKSPMNEHAKQSSMDTQKEKSSAIKQNCGIRYPVDEQFMSPLVGLSLQDNVSESPVHQPSYESNLVSLAGSVKSVLSSGQEKWTKSPINERSDKSSMDSQVERSNATHKIKCDVSPELLNIPKEILNLSSPGDNEPILPSNAKNVSAINPKLKCVILEGSFPIEDFMWSSLFTGEEKLNVFTYPYILKTLVKRFVNNTCILIINYVKYKSNGEIVINCKCKHVSCKKIKLILKSNKTVDVLSQTVNFSHLTPITAQLRGVDRAIKRNKLHSINPSAVKRQDLMNLNEDRLNLTKCLQGVKSDSTLRKIRSEALCYNDRSKNDIIDLVLFQQDHLNYVREVSFPFTVKIHSTEQILVLKSQKENAPLLHLDATGSVVKKPVCGGYEIQCKRVFLYSGVIQIPSHGRLFSVYDMITSCHNTNSVFKMLTDLKRHCVEHNIWPVFSGVVTDMSLVLINASCQAFNDCCLLEYLTNVFNFLTHKENMKYQFTPLFLCCAHLIKNFCKDIDRSQVKDKKMLKDVLANLVMTTNMEQTDHFIRNIFILLHSQYVSPDTTLAQENIVQMCKSERNSVELLLNMGTTVSSDIKGDKLKTSSVYKNSPFYKRALDVINDTEFVVHAGATENQFYDPELFESFLNKYVPFLPMWTNILKEERVSNAPIESHFGHIKNNVLNGQKNIKCTQFIRKLRGETISKSKEILNKIPKSKLTKPNRDDEPIETWKKRQRPDHTHFMGRFLKKRPRTDCEPDETVPLVEDEEDFLNCFYCGHGTGMGPDEKTTWVACDSCNKWVHIACASDTNKEAVGEKFYCDVCMVSNYSSSGRSETSPKDNARFDMIPRFENGLFKNADFYDVLPDNRGYIVTRMPLSYPMILIEDFKSLDPETELTNFAMDHLLYTYNVDNQYNVISVAKSNCIFDDSDILPAFVDSVQLLPDKDNVFPLCLHRHFTMAILSLKNKSLTIIDPLGKENTLKSTYKNKMNDFLEMKNMSERVKYTKTPRHVLQTDHYNCGPILIHLFSLLVQNKPLLTKKNFDKYRDELKTQLLEHSEPVENMCLFCGKLVDSEEFKCRCCKRAIHNVCYVSRNDINKGLNYKKKAVKFENLCDVCYYRVK